MTVIDSYSSDNADSTFSLPNVFPSTDSYAAVGIALTLGATEYILTQFTAYMRKIAGSPDGQLVVRVYDITGTVGTDAKPTGDALAESDEVEMSSIGGTMQAVEFDFSGANQITLEASTDYIFAVLVKAATVLDGSNYCAIYADAGSTHSSNMCYHYGGSWRSSTSYGIVFSLEGNLPPIDFDIELNQFPDNVANSTTAAAIETWLDGLSITTVRDITINWQGGFYKVVVAYE